jgi:hypothetical protein
MALAGTALASALGLQAIRFLGLRTYVPDTWVRQQPDFPVRLHQFAVPGPPGVPAGTFVVYHFGPDRGGTVEENIVRWTGLFKAEGGGPATPRVRRLHVAGLPVTTVELRGTYSRGMGPVPGPPLPDQILLVAVLETPHGNVTLQLYGASATVEQSRAAFAAVVQSVHRARERVAGSRAPAAAPAAALVHPVGRS